jgi:hypothetical protein
MILDDPWILFGKYHWKIPSKYHVIELDDGKIYRKAHSIDGQEPWFPVPIFPAKPLENTMGTYPEVADLRLEDGHFAVAQCAGSAPRGWEMSFLGRRNGGRNRLEAAVIFFYDNQRHVTFVLEIEFP